MTAARDASRDLGNRRTHRRAELRSPVLIDSASSYLTGRCRDVSEVGMGVEVTAPLTVGANVDVYFELPTGVAVEARAQVARSDGKSAGIRFAELSADGSRALKAYCESWRQKLLANCARRAESVRDLRPQSYAPPYFPSDFAGIQPYDSSEMDSGVRLRAASPVEPDTATQKK